MDQTGIVPDVKDWTWTLERACPECRFDASRIQGSDVAGLLREQAGWWSAVLARADVRRRPEESTWSALEYGCHVRDCCDVFATRVRSMLAEESPQFPNWDQDATAVEKDYGASDPQQVQAELAAAASALAAVLDQVSAADWGRPGLRSNGSAFTVDSLARYFAHDLVHHGWDVRPR